MANLIAIIISSSACYVDIIVLNFSANPPLMSDVDIAQVIYEANTLRLTLQVTIINRRRIPTLEVSPYAVSLGSLQNLTFSTFSANITLFYNTNYTLTIRASNCAGQDRKHINFLRGMYISFVQYYINFSI